ncbi:hypothetical protein ULMA_24980 [Patiriisocius marinus]|uniref:Uncharacterized protein n=1 Tax=Patiriisocius marinus TaxID=1397112 RepID=A0A5J4J3E2_9FLAO|nr:hypothetical protein [Patiriisocius marinus]GER60390.1 hypothetical protein ULMA_24980 [Patiriisocius marinus]
MKFYKISNSNNLNEVGYYPHCESMKEVGDIQKDIIPFDGRIEINFILPQPKLNKKAKLNNLIGVAAIPSRFLVIDDSFLTLLSKYEIGTYQKWKLQSWQNNNLIDKYNLFIINDTAQHKYINFAQSEFYVGSFKDFKYKGNVIEVKNYEDYLFRKEKLRENKLWLRESKVVFNLQDVDVDMFRFINAPCGGYYVSEKLKNTIEENGLSGIAFQEIL